MAGTITAAGWETRITECGRRYFSKLDNSVKDLFRKRFSEWVKTPNRNSLKPFGGGVWSGFFHTWTEGKHWVDVCRIDGNIVRWVWFGPHNEATKLYRAGPKTEFFRNESTDLQTALSIVNALVT